MKIETYLIAMVMCVKRIESIECGDTVYDSDTIIKRNRQYRAFYNRILRVGAEKDEEIRFQHQLNNVSNNQIDDLSKDITEKDKQIKKWREDYASAFIQYSTWKDIAAERDRQLAEKDKKIKTLNIISDRQFELIEQLKADHKQLRKWMIRYMGNR